ncbi:transmembrane protein [Cystoisospora suis]|uniref:Transmembrane protein n=1 Tax=Cystoisospora suis TaxID=483139 RepID=A0A2C6KK45_9APIC|nr:transmembrane protein [Cystoisospora suis]
MKHRTRFCPVSRAFVVSAFVFPFVLGFSSHYGEAGSRNADGYTKESHWGASLMQQWSDPKYLPTIAKTVETLDQVEFWLTLLSKQVPLQDSKARLKTQRIDRHKLEQRRKRQALQAFLAAPHNVDDRAVREDVELRSNDLSLFSLDWIGPRTCSDVAWAETNDVCAVSLETDIHVLYLKLVTKTSEVRDYQNRLFSTGGPEVSPSDPVFNSKVSYDRAAANSNVPVPHSKAETFNWEATARDMYLPALRELQAADATPELFSLELTQLMSVLDREEVLRTSKAELRPRGDQGSTDLSDNDMSTWSPSSDMSLGSEESGD